VAERFLYAIGYAGLAATIWAAIVPALLRAHRVNASVAQIPRLGRQADDCADSGVRCR
jgi:LPS sulfotransferase NodH